MAMSATREFPNVWVASNSIIGNGRTVSFQGRYCPKRRRESPTADFEAILDEDLSI